MASFDQAFVYLYGNEGSDLYKDARTGEYSRFGVTLKTAAALGLCAPGDRSFIEGLTEDRAKEIYLDHFWAPAKLSSIREQAVANKLLDMVVNMGPGQAVKLLQRALNALGATLSPDGLLGYQTLAAANAADGYQLLTELRATALQFYRNLVDQHPDLYANDWEGWKARAEK